MRVINKQNKNIFIVLYIMVIYGDYDCLSWKMIRVFLDGNDIQNNFSPFKEGEMQFNFVKTRYVLWKCWNFAGKNVRTLLAIGKNRNNAQ